MGSTDYALSTLARAQLSVTRTEIKMEQIKDAYENKKHLLDCMEHTKTDAVLTLKLMFSLSGTFNSDTEIFKLCCLVLPLTSQLTKLSGSTWNKTLQEKISQRTDMLLCHEFHNRKFLLPEKKPTRTTDASRRSGPAYEGGLVLEPKAGLYNNLVLLLDFNSLYPSIIQQFNICFTTVDRSGDRVAIRQDNAMATLPVVIKELVAARRIVKDLMAKEADPRGRHQRDIRQRALKLTANGMYGCLGFPHARFSCKPLAELITAKGREILARAKDIIDQNLTVEGRKLEVIYGDTDSIMISTDCQDYKTVMNRIAEEIKKKINALYRAIQIDVDGIFGPLLLLTKKKYAAMKLTMKNKTLVRHREEKGVDIVRRDCPRIAKRVGGLVLQEILSGKPMEEMTAGVHEQLRRLKAELENGEVPLSEFEIVKELSRNPEAYSKAESQPHVQVALRRKAQGHKDGTLQGHTVPYIICTTTEGTSRSQAERAYHPDEVKSRPRDLNVDMLYYLERQVTGSCLEGWAVELPLGF